MGEISFSFQAVSEPKHETAFQYTYANSIEYGFTYERCIALSNASILNSPVSIIKVAAGLSALYPLFVDKTAHSMIYHKSMLEISKVKGNISEKVNKKALAINKVPHSTEDPDKLLDIHKPSPYDFILYDKIASLKRIKDERLTVLDSGYFAQVYDYFNLDKESLFFKKYFYTNTKENLILERSPWYDGYIFKKAINLKHEKLSTKQKDTFVSLPDNKIINLPIIYIMSSRRNKAYVNKAFFVGRRDLIANNKLQFHQLYQGKNQGNIVENIMTAPESEIIANILENINTIKERQRTKMAQSFFGSRQDGKVDSVRDVIIEKTSAKTDVSKNINAYRPTASFLLYDILGAGNSDKEAILNPICSSLPPNKFANSFDNCNVITSDKEGDIFETLNFSKSIKTLTGNQWLNIGSDIDGAGLYNIYIGNLGNKKVNIDEGFKLNKADIEFLFYKNFDIVKQDNELNTFANILLTNERKYGTLLRNAIASPFSITASITSSKLSFRKFSQQIQEYFIEFANITSKTALGNKSYMTFRERIKMQMLDGQDNGFKERLEINGKYDSLLTYQENRYTDFIKGQYLAGKDKLSIQSMNNFLEASTNDKQINIKNNSLTVTREKKPLIEFKNTFLSKTRNSFLEFETNSWGLKTKPSLSIFKSITGGKFKKGLMYGYNLSAQRTRYGFSIGWQINGAAKQKPPLNYFKSNNVIKTKVSLNRNTQPVSALKEIGEYYIDKMIPQGSKVTTKAMLLKNYSAYKLSDNVYIDNIVSACVYNKNIFNNHDLSFNVTDRQANTFNNYSAKSSNKLVDSIFKLFELSKRTKEFIENKWAYGALAIGQTNLFSRYTITGTKGDKIAFEDSLLGLDKFGKESFYDKSIYAYKNTGTTYTFDIDTFAVIEQKNSIILKDTSVTLSGVTADVSQTDYWVKKFEKEIQESFILSASIVDKFLFDNQKDIQLSKRDKSIVRDKNQKGVKKDRIGIVPEKQSIWASPEARVVQDLYQDLFATKDRLSFVVPDTFFNITQERRSMALKADFLLFAEKTRKPIILWNNHHVYRQKIGARFDTYDNNIYKILNSIPDFIQDLWLKKDSYSINVPDMIRVNTEKKAIELNKDLWGFKNHQDTIVFRQMDRVFRNTIIINALEVDAVIQDSIPIDILNAMNNDFSGTIVPISKIRNQAYIDNMTTTCVKAAGNISGIDKDVVASVIEKPVAAPDAELFFDMEGHSVYLDLRNTEMIKDKIKLNIRKDIFGLLDSHSFAYEEFVWAKKEKASIWMHSDENAFKARKELNLKDDLAAAIKDRRGMYVYDTIFVETTPALCYYSYDTWADKDSLKMKIQQQVNAFRDKKEVQLLDMISPAIKENAGMYYDDVLFSQRQLRDCELLREIDEVNRISKDMAILPNDFSNWAWVYETPDPLEGDLFGIDELLLPENDTRYQDFEDIIFDKVNMRPKNPVKEIDDNTFIAKFPTKHPLPNYDKIGIVYIDVETSIMHTIFLKYYRIWQAKVFEFGTMTMTQSTKKMLEYMYTWIMEYFPVEQLEQALRVFRLIRWYSETSIIRNSQYIITYEYGLLESKLNTGGCLIPNDLDTNDSMYVDAKLGVIKNNPIYIGTYAAHVTFTVANKKNTTFTFSLSNTIGSVNIYINDELVDTVSKSALNLTYELPFSGDDNIIKIEKTKENNLNGTFYIGNIKVPSGTFKDLNIEFDPTLKAGNKPLNEVAQKMMVYANLYQNREEMYNIIREGNLGVGETYKRLDEYWKLHHQDKTKGKRLTIKEV